MSDKKKAYAGAAYGTPTAVEPNNSATAADATGTPRAVMTATDDIDDNEGVRRGQNQNVLPGILGKQLRAAYGELLNTPVPDRFGELIKQLQRQEAGGAAAAPQDEKEGK